ncbi:DUF5946 family protein [Nocardia sp. X0981]
MTARDDERAVPGPCPECGVEMPTDGCWTRVHQLLEIEHRTLAGIDSELALRAHFFAIGTYQLQHPSRLTAAAVTNLRERVASMVRSPRPIRELRRDMARHVRDRKVVRDAPADDRGHIDPRWPVHWTVTAHDVVTADDDAAYPDAVARWAAATITDLDRALGLPGHRASGPTGR